MMPDGFAIISTQSRRALLGRLRVFPRTFMRLPSMLGTQPTISHTVFRLSFWSRVRAAWQVTGTVYRVGDQIVEVI